jgi:integrase
MSARSETRRKRCSLELHGKAYRIVYSWAGCGRVRCRTPWGRDEVDRAERLVDLMAYLLEGAIDPRSALRDVEGLVFTPRLDAATIDDLASMSDVCAASPEPNAGSPGRGRPLTIADFYHRWVAPMVAPAVRRAQERDYRRHLEGYVLPRIGGLPIRDLTASALCDLRDELLTRGGEGGAALSRKYVRNILGASLRAMVRAANDDGLFESRPNPYASQRWRNWPRTAERDEGGEADPFSPEDRDRILSWFRERTYGVHNRAHAHPAFLGWVMIQFTAGLSPSEASGLLWGDVDSDKARPFVIVRRSYHLGRYNEPKTRTRRRTVVISPELAALIEELRPLVPLETDTLFPNTNGKPIEPKSFAHWYRCLRALKIRVRGAYAMKDTFVSIALMAGSDAQWLEQQTGVALPTLKAHYARYFPGVAQQQLARIAAYERGTLTPALTPEQAESDRQEVQSDAKTQKIQRL